MIISEWEDINGRLIKAGDKIKNDANDPPILDVLEDDKGSLYLGDMDTPFDNCYQFHRFWEVVVS